MLTPRNIFKLAVRIVGLIFLYHGLMFFPEIFAAIYDRAPNGIGILLMVAWQLAVAFCLLAFAPKITDFFYAKSED